MLVLRSLGTNHAAGRGHGVTEATECPVPVHCCFSASAHFPKPSPLRALLGQALTLRDPKGPDPRLPLRNWACPHWPPLLSGWLHPLQSPATHPAQVSTHLCELHRPAPQTHSRVPVWPPRKEDSLSPACWTHGKARVNHSPGGFRVLGFDEQARLPVPTRCVSARPAPRRLLPARPQPCAPSPPGMLVARRAPCADAPSEPARPLRHGHRPRGEQSKPAYLLARGRAGRAPTALLSLLRKAGVAGAGWNLEGGRDPHRPPDMRVHAQDTRL